MALTLLEFTVFGIYLAMILVSIVIIQTYTPVKQIQEAELDSSETVEEADSDVQEEPFDPTKESYTMTENPILRHRFSQEKNDAERSASGLSADRTVPDTETETETVKPMNMEEVD